MTLQATNEGDVLLLKYCLNNVAQANPTIRLFTNNISPAKTDTIATYAECSATGYTAIGLTGASWSVSTAGSTTTATYPEITFSMTASVGVYGYYVTNAGKTTTLWSEAFGQVENIPSGGGAILLTPKIVLN
jgi:hypothetical protein